ncbi:MAG TPA: class I SAM-dependent methyltransferase [Pseudomonadales bacterium]|nr:class I SAM-dependent methyltransferase [Pseudomonadales bacterium]
MNFSTPADASDPWLERHRPQLAGRSIFEIGCGGGRDTRELVEVAHRVVALDVSARSIERGRTVAPAAEFHRQDVRAPRGELLRGRRTAEALLRSRGD